MSVQERLIQAMEAQGITQVQLVKKTGIIASSVSRYVAGFAEPSSATVRKLANVLEVNPAWLAGYDVPANYAPDGSALLPSMSAIRLYDNKVIGRKELCVENSVGILHVSRELTDSGNVIGVLLHERAIDPWDCEETILIVRLQDMIRTGQVALIKMGDNDALCRRVVTQGKGLNLYKPDSSGQRQSVNENDIKTLPLTIIGRVLEVRAKPQKYFLE